MESVSDGRGEICPVKRAILGEINAVRTCERSNSTRLNNGADKADVEVREVEEVT